jgi:AP-3 complex subunit delta-1
VHLQVVLDVDKLILLQFGSLAPLEPRLVKKLQHPITDLISTTPAISLLYECVHTCIVGGMLQGTSGNALAKTCVDKLAAFLTDPDQNRALSSHIRCFESYSL